MGPWFIGENAATGTAAPDLQVAVEGTDVSPDELYPVKTDPQLDIDASAPGGGTLDLLVVEIDGSVRREWDLNSASVSKTLTPDVTGGEHDVDVIVRDSNGDISSIRFVVRKDNAGPLVWLTDPYDTEPRRNHISNGSVDGATVTFAGGIDEPTGPTDIKITRTHRGTGQTASAGGTHSGSSFSHEIDLGLGVNQIHVSAEDDLGNVRTYEFWVSVDDDDPPSVSLDAPSRTSAEEIEVAFTVTDNVWVNRSTLRTDSFTAPDVIRPAPYDPNQARRSVTFTRRLDLNPGENRVVVVARDNAGNVAEVPFTIERTSGQIGYREPAITVDTDRTGFAASQSLYVSGSITGTGLTTATIETLSGEGGDRLDYQFLHRGDPVGRIAIDAEVTVGDGESTVVIRAEDETGNRTRKEFVVDAETQELRLDSGSAGASDASNGGVDGQSAGDGETTPSSGDDTPPPDGAERDGETSVSAVTPDETQLSEASVLLDQGRRPLGAASIDGDEYVAYRVRNTLPYASGIEVYRNGELVTEEDEADRVLSVLAAERVLEENDYENASGHAAVVTTESAARTQFKSLAWRRAVERVDQSELEAMRDTVATARDIRQLTGRVGGAIDGVLSLVNWMKSTGLAGVTVWDLATNAAPQLDTFVDGLESLRGSLREWEQSAAGVTSTLPTAIDGIERAQSGEDVDYERVGRNLGEAMTALEDLRSQTADLRGRLQDTADAANRIGGALGQVQGYGGQLANRFTSFGSFMDERASEVGQFEDRLGSQANQLREVRSFASSEQDRLLSDWKSERSQLKSDWQARQSAESKVNLSLGVGGVSVLGGLGFGVWRRLL